MTTTSGNDHQGDGEGVHLQLGQLVATPGALAALERAGEEPALYLARHARGDWGEVSEEDWRENDFSLLNGFRILSVYTTGAGDRLWIITERDRSATTIMLPREY